MRQFTRPILPAAAACLLIAHAAPAKTLRVVGMISPETPAHMQPAPNGTVKGTLDTATDILRYKIDYAGLSGPVLAAHIHGPAASGQSAGVLVPIPGPYHTGMAGEVTVPAAAAKDITAGETYLNLHTAKNPDGEARAQLNVE